MNCFTALALGGMAVYTVELANTKWFLRNVTVSTITTSENPNILKLNLTNRHFTKQMYIFIQNQIIYWSHQCCKDLSIHDVTGFFSLCEEFSFICIDDEDSSHFNKFRSSWLLNKQRKTNRSMKCSIPKAFSLFLTPPLWQGAGTELLPKDPWDCKFQGGN